MLFRLVLICLLVTGSQVRADLCGTLHNVHRLEIALRDSRAATGPELDQIQRLGSQLAEYYIPNDTARAAVRTYVHSLAVINAGPNIFRPANRVAAHLSGRHQVALRNMRAHAQLICIDGTFVATPAPRGPDVADRDLQIGPVRLPIGGVKVTAVTFGLGVLSTLVGLWTSARMRRKKLQLARHDCDIGIRVTSGQWGLDTRALDISAVGLKVKVPPDESLPPSVEVEIGGKHVAGRTTWQNAHFAGLQLSPALPLDFVAKVSAGKIRRQRRTRRNNRSAARAKTATEQAQTAIQP